MVLFEQHESMHVGYKHLILAPKLPLLRSVHDNAVRQVGEFRCQALGNRGVRLRLDYGLHEFVVLLAVTADE